MKEIINAILYTFKFEEIDFLINVHVLVLFLNTKENHCFMGISNINKYNYFINIYHKKNVC